MKKILKGIIGFLSAVAAIALLYGLSDSLISGLWPQFNGVMVYRFAEFFPRSLGIYFIFLLPLALLGFPLYYISKRLPGLRKRELKVVYNAIGAAAPLIIPIILFEIPNKLSLSYFKPVFLVTDFVGLLLMAFITVYLAPLVLSITADRFPVFIVKTAKVAAYVSLVLVAVTLFSLTILPEITRPPYNPESPNLLVISIDTLRKDHLSIYGYDKIETPNIDAFLESGTAFDNAYCSSPWTLPSLASFLTGYQPSVIGVDSFNLMNPALKTLPEYLHDEGYRTECYNTNFLVYPEYGFGRGFDVYMNADDIRLIYPFFGTRLYRYSCALYAGIRSRLGIYPTYPEFNRVMTVNAIKKQSERPFFIWCHFLDPHDAYTPPDRYIPDYLEYSSESAIAFRDRMAFGDVSYGYIEDNKIPLMMLYDGETSYVDEQVGLILDTVTKTGCEENTIIVMFNDHGEEFWEHGRRGHGYNVYPEQTDMILSFKNPNVENLNIVSDRYLSHVDILPTILDALGLSLSMQTQGESFYAALDSGGSINKPILTEYMVNGEIEIKAVRKDGFLFARNMETGETELYNLCEDPQALNDISGTLPEIEDELSGELDTLISENRELRLNFEYDKELALPKERVDNMRALGYMGN